jgi:uncharacterized OsmC-like protein
MDGTIHVTHVNDDHFEIAIRGHVIHIDQPDCSSGTDMGPSPTELFAASLAGCVAFYVRRFLSRHGLSSDGLAVDAMYAMAGNPSRVATITVSITPPAFLPDDRIPALMAVASHCTVHNTLEDPPGVRIVLTTSSGAHASSELVHS